MSKKDINETEEPKWEPKTLFERRVVNFAGFIGYYGTGLILLIIFITLALLAIKILWEFGTFIGDYLGTFINWITN